MEPPAVGARFAPATIPRLYGFVTQITDRDGEGRDDCGAASSQSCDMLPLAHEPDILPAECAHVARSLWDFLDGRVEPPFEDELRRHIAACEPCLRYAEFQRRLIANLAAGQSVPPRPEMRKRILTVLHREGFGAIKS